MNSRPAISFFDQLPDRAAGYHDIGVLSVANDIDMPPPLNNIFFGYLFKISDAVVVHRHDLIAVPQADLRT